jgi:hypothetical protein
LSTSGPTTFNSGGKKLIAATTGKPSPLTRATS